MPLNPKNQPKSNIAPDDDPRTNAAAASGPIIIILKRWDNAATLWRGEAADIKQAILKAATEGQSLAFVDLTGADLEALDLPPRTNLQSACLKKVRLSRSRIQNADFLNAILDDGSIVIAPHVNAFIKADMVAFSTNRGVRYKGRDFFGERNSIRRKFEKDRAEEGEFEKQCQWIEACENQGRTNRIQYAVKAIAESGATFNFGTLSDPEKQSGDCIDIEAEITVNESTFTCGGGQIIRCKAGGNNGEMVVDFIPAINKGIEGVLQHFALERDPEATSAIHEAVLNACQLAWDQLDRGRCISLQAVLSSPDDIKKAISRAVRANRWDDYFFWLEVAATGEDGNPKISADAWNLKIEKDGNFVIESGDKIVCEYRNPNPDDTDWIANAFLLHSSPRVLQHLEYLLDQYIESVLHLNALQKTSLNQQQLEIMSETQQILAHARGEIR